MHDGVDDAPLKAVERWFVRRLPHFVGRKDSVWTIWSRAIPLLVVAYVLLGLNALDIHDWTWQRNVLAGLFVLVVLVLIWAVRQRFNVGLVALFSQAIQITAAALAMFGFFVLFGLLAIPIDTSTYWTQLDAVHVIAHLSIGGRELILSDPVLRVAGFLGAFTGMYFTVVLSTDSTYREEFAEDIGPELRQALAVRVLYREALAGHDGAGD